MDADRIGAYCNLKMILLAQRASRTAARNLRKGSALQRSCARLNSRTPILPRVCVAARLKGRQGRAFARGATNLRTLLLLAVGSIVYRIDAQDLHLVLAVTTDRDNRIATTGQLRQCIQFAHVACDDSPCSAPETRSPGAEPSGKKRGRRSVGRPPSYRTSSPSRDGGGTTHGGNDARIEVER
jgi:hypothetical protein